MFDHLLESSHRDDSNKWSNIGFGQEMKELASIEIHFTHLIWRSEPCQNVNLHDILNELKYSNHVDSTLSENLCLLYLGLA